MVDTVSVTTVLIAVVRLILELFKFYQERKIKRLPPPRPSDT